MRKILLWLTLLPVFFSGCGDTPVFTEMKTNRLKVIIKGTFETSQTSNFVSMNSLSANHSSIEDDSVDTVVSPAQDLLPTTFMFDIAELRLDGKRFARYRDVIEASLAGDGTSVPFFNGEGVVLKNDDPGEGQYQSVQIYIRKMIFDNAMVYQSIGTTMTYEEPSEVIFHENDREGFDFNQLQVNSYWDSLRLESSNILRNFPIEIPIIGGLDYKKDNEETVLEIRIVIKNYLKKYEYDYFDEGVFKVCHYYAPSDWLRDVRAGERDIGRNLHAVARAYVPSKSGSITVSNPSGGYVFAIPADEVATDIARYTISATGVALRNAVTSSDLPIAPSDPGAYIESVLDYYLDYESYKYEWNQQASTLTLEDYTTAWDTYENAVHGDPDGDYRYGLKIPPYVGYGTSVTFSEMAPGTYYFYRADVPAYGQLFLNGSISVLNSGASVTISEGTNTGI